MIFFNSEVNVFLVNYHIKALYHLHDITELIAWCFRVRKRTRLSTRVLLQRTETCADSGLRERLGQSQFKYEKRAEKEAQSGVAELPAAGSRGSNKVIQYP